MDEPPPFDLEQARLYAHAVYDAVGRSARSETSLRAMHAVVQRLQHPQFFGKLVIHGSLRGGSSVSAMMAQALLAVYLHRL